MISSWKHQYIDWSRHFEIGPSLHKLWATLPQAHNNLILKEILFLDASLTHAILCLINLFVGSCVAQGFTGCCTSSCVVSSNISTCYCDQLCYNFGDCCSDIEEAGCFPPGLTTTTSSTVTPTPTSSSIAVSTPGMCELFMHVTKSTYNKLLRELVCTYATCTHKECMHSHQILYICYRPICNRWPDLKPSGQY